MTDTDKQVRENRPLAGLILFFQLIFAAELACVTAVIITKIFERGEIHVLKLRELIIEAFNMSLVATFVTLPALIILAFPVAIHLKESKNRNILEWIKIFTAVAFVYSLLWFPFKDFLFVVYLYLITGAFTGLIFWSLVYVPSVVLCLIFFLSVCFVFGTN